MKKFRLAPIVEFEKRINVIRNVNGRSVYGFVKVRPGETYELEEDPLFTKSLIQNAVIKRPYSQALVELLDASGVSYEIVRCKSCGGSVKKIEYSIIEVIDDD